MRSGEWPRQGSEWPGCLGTPPPFDLRMTGWRLWECLNLFGKVKRVTSVQRRSVLLEWRWFVGSGTCSRDVGFATLRDVIS